MNLEELIIGVSTGWLYAKNVFSSRKQEEILQVTGAIGIEICLDGWKDKRTFSLKKGKKFNPEIFSYRSLHFPDIVRDQDHQIIVAKEIITLCNATVAVSHPLKERGEYPVKSYEGMIASEVPFAIENMDSQKDSGFNLAELKGLVKDIGCYFVLDLHHAFTHDKTMSYANDLFESLGPSLVHLHVSGATNNGSHSLVYRAINTKEIISFLGQVLSIKKLPLILEGEYSTSNELRQEIEFLRKELC